MSASFEKKIVTVLFKYKQSATVTEGLCTSCIQWHVLLQFVVVVLL